MQPISFQDFHPEPGQLNEWIVSTSTAAAASAAPADPTPLSYNQQLHLQSERMAALAGVPGNPWIGAAFEIAGEADLEALGRAFTAWVRRHSALRSGFRDRGASVERFTLAADEVSLVRAPAREFTATDELRDYLAERFASGTNALSWPMLVTGVISRPESSTVFVALDHVAGDGYSLALAVWELQTSYEAFARDEQPELPEVGSFHELCHAERARGEAIDADDPAVTHWREFVRACGGTAPTFPLDLGAAEGELWPQHVYNQHVLSAADTATLEEICRRDGGGVFAGVLAAMGAALRHLTGQEHFRTITPLHTRHQPEWQAAMGWFITCAPLEFSLTEAASFGDLVPRAHTATRAAVGLATYPAVRMIELLGSDFRITRRDLFSMVSYTDYRKMPGADRYAEWKPITIGQVTDADDSHVWISRVPDGLHVAVRHPDTPIARDVIDDYTKLIRNVLNHVVDTGDCAIAAVPLARPFSLAH